MKKFISLIAISMIALACETDDELHMSQFKKSESYNQKIETSYQFTNDFQNSELTNKAVGDSIPDKDIIHWHH